MRTREARKDVRIVDFNRRIDELEDLAWLTASPRLGGGRVDFALIMGAVGLGIVVAQHASAVLLLPVARAVAERQELPRRRSNHRGQGCVAVAARRRSSRAVAVLAGAGRAPSPPVRLSADRVVLSFDRPTQITHAASQSIQSPVTASQERMPTKGVESRVPL